MVPHHITYIKTLGAGLEGSRKQSNVAPTGSGRGGVTRVTLRHNPSPVTRYFENRPFERRERVIGIKRVCAFIRPRQVLFAPFCRGEGRRHVFFRPPPSLSLPLSHAHHLFFSFIQLCAHTCIRAHPTHTHIHRTLSVSFSSFSPSRHFLCRAPDSLLFFFSLSLFLPLVSTLLPSQNSDYYVNYEIWIRQFFSLHVQARLFTAVVRYDTRTDGRATRHLMRHQKSIAQI